MTAKSRVDLLEFAVYFAKLSVVQTVQCRMVTFWRTESWCW